MGSRTVDSLECFSSLAESVPPWIERVSDLISHTTAKHAEFAAEYTKMVNTGKRPSSSTTASSRREKNSSLHTHRPGDDDASGVGNRQPQAQQPGRQETDDISMDPLMAIRLQQCQRRGSSRKNPVAMPKPPNPAEEASRDRRHLIIRYDSHTQDVLEMLVRDIGGARNSIRKGRMNHMMKHSFGLKSTLPSNRDDPSKPMFRSSRAEFSKPSPTARSSPYDSIDKLLESAQSLCETSAYRFLRSGDCSQELSQIKDHLTSALGAAKVEVERARAEKEEAERENAKRADMEQPKKEEIPNTTAPAVVLPKKSDNEEPKEAPQGTPIIEVDDATDTSSVSIDFGAFRRSRF